MDTNKMRDQFEHWASGQFVMPIEVIKACRYEDTYANTVMNIAWRGWAASRESVVVELPPRKSIDHYCYDQGANCNAEGHNQCLAQAAAAIEAQGLKVAP